MIIKNQYKYLLTDRFGTIQVSPLGESDFTISYEQEDDGKYFYSKQFQGKITFIGEAYMRLKTIEQSIYLCSKQQLKVIRICEGSEVVLYDGFFKLSEAEWDDDLCRVILKFEKSTPDKCLQDNKSVKINILQAINPAITVKLSSPSGVIEYKNCTRVSSSPQPSDYWCGTGQPDEGNWTLYKWTTNSPDGNHYSVANSWAREVITVPCGTIVPPDWKLIESCISGTEKYAKSVTLYDCQVYGEPDGNSNGMTCKIVGYDNTTQSIDNGRLLNSLLVYMLNEICPGMQVVSDFFQINPENPNAINYVTNKASFVNQLVIFQKADVKRPDVVNNSSRADINFEKLMETLNFMFNVFYSVENGVFRLEHVSWFSRFNGMDLTQPKYSRYTVGMKRYTYDVDSIPNREVWRFKEQSFGDLYNGTIDYSIGCTVAGKSDEKNYLVDEFTTDVQLAIDNPDSDSNTVEDAGFVIMATRKIANEYYLISDQRLNDSLSWKSLINSFQYYYRPVNKGVYLNDEINFNSTKPLKKGAKISVPVDCADLFDPNDSIKTVLGTGIVDKATFNMLTCMVELELKYDVFTNLVDNEPPHIDSGTVFQTYKNIPKNLPITVTDSDGTITDLYVIYPPANGTLEILSYSELKYTPNANFEGLDFFTIQAKDNWSEVSNVASFGVEVLSANLPPVANDDNFNVWQGEPFTSTSIFSNDVDDFTFTLITPTITTAQGIVININNSGVFSYTPAQGFLGVDSFDYTIEDNLGAQSSATVYLHVGSKKNPVAVDDNYQVLSAQTLNVDGSYTLPKLILNDYVPDGVSYPLLTTAETKPTALGGSVQINGDGTFVYSAPAGVVSQIDNFDYTVYNSFASDIGNVKVSLLPTIYVKIVKSDMKNVGHPGQASYSRTADFTLYYYADSAGTTPVDVSGLNFRVNILEHVVISGSSGSSSYDSIYRSGILSGVSTKIYEDRQWYDSFSDGQGNNNTFNMAMSIYAGAYIILT